MRPTIWGLPEFCSFPDWYWTDDNPRWNYLVSPVAAGSLLPMRYYAKVVAQYGSQFLDNDGSDWTRNREHPGSQELIWGLGDYPITPEAHMRNIRKLGETALREAEQALKTVKLRRDEAQALYHYMKAYKLLADYYEQKVLAASAALIYEFGGLDPTLAKGVSDLPTRQSIAMKSRRLTSGRRSTSVRVP